MKVQSIANKTSNSTRDVLLVRMHEASQADDAFFVLSHSAGPKEDHFSVNDDFALYLSLVA